MVVVSAADVDGTGVDDDDRVGIYKIKRLRFFV